MALLTQRSGRMMRLLDDLLEYSRINRNKFKNEPVNLKDISTDVFSMQDKTEGFTLSAPDVEITIPKTPLEIVLRNLISNAIKHHESKSGAINVLYESNPDYHIIIVEDDGPGIPLELHEKALEMFQTLKPRDKVEGSGMGLAMIKRIVEHYKGKILITSDGKHGTKISIYWPLSNS
ncbi:Sensor histidine kinase [Cycloclasticus sp. P1]|nr:Sensor histidine kinase [Cycloclasticus sp. P1]